MRVIVRLNAATTRLAASIRRWQRYWWRPLYCGAILLLTAPGGRLGPMKRTRLPAGSIHRRTGGTF